MVAPPTLGTRLIVRQGRPVRAGQFKGRVGSQDASVHRAGRFKGRVGPEGEWGHGEADDFGRGSYVRIGPGSIP